MNYAEVIMSDERKRNLPFQYGTNSLETIVPGPLVEHPHIKGETAMLDEILTTRQLPEPMQNSSVNSSCMLSS